MPSIYIRSFEIEYTGVPSRISNGWMAYMTIYLTSNNPAHRNRLIPTQRVHIYTIFPSQAEAEEAARSHALSMISETSK